MLNRYGWWQWLIIVGVIVPGIFFALPNLFGDDPGIQVRGSRGTDLSSADFDRLKALVAQPGAGLIRGSLDVKGASFRFATPEAQLKARDLFEDEFEDRYTIALTLLPAAPAWFESMSARPMYLGLDLRGGVHFLMEVDMDGAIRRMEERYVADLRSALRTAKVRHRGVRRKSEGGIDITLRNVSDQDKARETILRELPDLELTDVEGDTPDRVLAHLSQRAKDELSEFALEQNITALRNRIDELGVAEPVVQRQGDRRIVVQLPGVQDTARAKRILGRTATLEMMLVDPPTSAEPAGQVRQDHRVHRGQPRQVTRRREYCSTERMTGGTPVRNHRCHTQHLDQRPPGPARSGTAILDQPEAVLRRTGYPNRTTPPDDRLCKTAGVLRPPDRPLACDRLDG